ncbi:response regulator [Chloroflexota bacterium]
MIELRNIKILIVDDDPADVLLLKNILEPDYLVIEEHDGLYAMEMVDREHPDLVLTDIVMPKKSGYSLCAYIKGNPNTKDIPVVMVTGFNTENNEEIAEDMGADGYLVKPVQPNEIRDIISRLLMRNHRTTKC